MTNTNNMNTERDQTKRFTNTVSGNNLIVGDRIDTRLVARTFGQLGEQLYPSHPNEEPEPKTQLVAITQIDRYDDIHRALLADVDTGTIIRAARHDSQSAWSQEEIDWTVRDIGTAITIDDVSELKLSRRDNEDIDEMKYVQDWVDMVIQDPANGYNDYNDERLIFGDVIKLRDIDGREAFAAFSLEDNQ